MYYIESHKFFEDKLTIFKKSNRGKSSSKNWYGRTYIQGASIELSSRTRNLKNAKTVLFDWYRGLQYKEQNDLAVHDILFNKLFSRYIEDRKINKKGAYTKNIETTFEGILKPFFYNRKINSIAKKTIVEFIKNRREKFRKKHKKEISRFTIQQDLHILSGFMNWCFENQYRNKSISVSRRWIDEVVGTKIGKQTRRTMFKIEEYKKLLKVSRNRIKASHNSVVRFRREYLHQFIIFMVHSGLRTGEAYNLKWEQVKFNTHKIKHKCFCDLKDVSGKSGIRDVITFFGSYFALKKIQQLNEIYNRPFSDRDKIFTHGFTRGLRTLLLDANLKTEKFGNRTLTRDSKSFRSTYISWSLIRGETAEVISRNCGTSPAVIKNFYSQYIEIKSFRKQLSEITNYKSLYQNGK